MTPTPTDFAPWWGVFETVRVVAGKPLFFVEHRAELGRAMATLGLTSTTDLAEEARTLPLKSGRWRWIVTRDTTRTMFVEENELIQDPVALSVSDVRVGSQNWDARFKTTSYLSHVQAIETADTPEVVLLNEQGNVASVSRGNIFWRRGDVLFTPAHEAGCRCGVVRAFVLGYQKIAQGHFAVAELLAAEEIFFTNSMKGIVSVDKLGERVFEKFPQADLLREAYAAEVALRLQNRLSIEHW